jgi:hypothetical protein
MHPCNGSATIVFAGYADRDALPTSVELEIEAFAFERLFYSVESQDRAEKNGAGFVLFRTFGQSDEIWRFIREAGLGVHFHQNIVRNSLSRYEGPAKEQFETGIIDEVNSSGDVEFENMSSEIYHELERVAGQNMRRALGTLASMNLRNLATMAERLVALQNLSLDLRGELPTVSAELVTAIVTPQHGFVIYDRLSDPLGIGTHFH